MRKLKMLIGILIVAAVLLCGAIGYMGFVIWGDNQAVFQDVTVELGTDSLSIRDFMTDKADAGRAFFVSDPSKINLAKTGQTRLVLRHGNVDHTVTLTVQDTMAPTADVAEVWDASVADALPEAEELVSNIRDGSHVTVYYLQEPTVPDDYSSVNATIVLEDESGNKLEKQVQFRFHGWMVESYTLELGTELTADMLLLNPEKDSDLLDAQRLQEISGVVGTHEVTASTGSSHATCEVTVRDTTAPTLKLQTVRRYPGEKAKLGDYLASVSDAAGYPQIRFAGEEPDYSQKGEFTVVIEAEDKYGNVAREETILWISDNMNPPEIKGADEPLSMEKYTEPDFLAGVSAKDDETGNCTITVDTSKLDNTKAGTYFITYSATDGSGNVGTYKRKVIVEPNEEDTAAMVKMIAESLPNDPEAIRDYVRETIAYSSSWGGDDPVWHGFTTSSGNCYVHALSLQALLEYRGYETQLIWVTNKSHYWLIIKLEDGWRHIDSTPSYQHRKISLMTDRERYLNLNGRNWDRSKWPACE